MRLFRAEPEEAGTVLDIVQSVIDEIYPRYYPAEVVQFFKAYHSVEAVTRDVEAGCVYVLEAHGGYVGTGTVLDGGHITRVFVRTEYQGRGFGTRIMDVLEEIASLHSGAAELDSSLPAYGMYLRRGYEPVSHKEISVSRTGVLVYDVMRKPLVKWGRLSFHNRIFSPVENTKNGEVSDSTRFYYGQDGDTVWADYAGGGIEKGFLVGRVTGEREIKFHYGHLNSDMEPRIGRCTSRVHVLPDGRLRMYESWQWLNGDRSAGESIIEELP